MDRKRRPTGPKREFSYFFCAELVVIMADLSSSKIAPEPLRVCDRHHKPWAAGDLAFTPVTGITINPCLPDYCLDNEEKTISVTGECDESQHPAIQNDSCSDRPDPIGLSRTALRTNHGPHVRFDTRADTCHRPPRLRI